jgi:hypothetical protein
MDLLFLLSESVGYRTSNSSHRADEFRNEMSRLIEADSVADFVRFPVPEVLYHSTGGLSRVIPTVSVLVNVAHVDTLVPRREIAKALRIVAVDGVFRQPGYHVAVLLQ